MSEHRTECAMYLAHGDDLRIVWANESYLSLLDERLASGAAIGKRLDEVSPLAPLRAEVLREVMRTGEPQGGEDRAFSVENGTFIHTWRAYRPLPEHVLVVIERRRADALGRA